MHLVHQVSKKTAKAVFFIFTLSVHLTGDLLCSLKLVCIISYAFIFFFDMRISHSFEKIIVTEIFQKNEFLKVIQLLKESFPLFLNGFLIIYIYSKSNQHLHFLLSYTTPDKDSFR